MTDYDAAKIATSDLPQYYLGEEVLTPIGRGLLISLSMPSNGLYLSPEQSDCVVWFSTDDSKCGWVQKEFKLKEINRIKEITCMNE